jgi:hypothetical protein
MHSLFVTGNHQEEQGHAYRDAIGHLIQHTRLRAVGDFR